MVYLICFLYVVVCSWKVAIYSDGDNIIIVIIILGFLGLGFKLVLLVLLWWHLVFSYPLAKCWWKIKLVKKNEDIVRFLKEGFNGSMK